MEQPELLEFCLQQVLTQQEMVQLYLEVLQLLAQEAFFLKGLFGWPMQCYEVERFLLMIADLR